jgi:farnesyl diphosphate synthase
MNNIDKLKYKEAITKRMNDFLPKESINRISSAMNYSCNSKGKLIRPLFVIQSANLFGGYNDSVLNAACAIEIIHCYSLVHDDLPAMDNDDIRRGEPTCHIKYDEATAILAGDALLTLAFEILADESISNDANIRCNIIKEVSKSIGYNGMAGGQMYDLQYENKIISEQEIITMLEMKTANLFIVAIKMGAMLANASIQDIKYLEEFGRKFGIAYQMVDDILDLIGDEIYLAKRTEKDLKLGKSSIVNLFGLEYAKQLANETLIASKNELFKLSVESNKYDYFVNIIDKLLSKIS